MYYTDTALGMFSVTRQQELLNRKPTPGAVIVGKRGLGFCECCQRHKPAPANRLKGWKCDDCQPA